MKNLMMLVLALGMIGCASAPRLKDFNKISQGYTKNQVLDILGEPNTTRFQDGKEILEYKALDGSEEKPRIVVLEDNEVIFYGRPSEYKAQSEAKGSNGHSISVSPTINANPVINISVPTTQTNPQAPQSYPQTGPQTSLPKTEAGSEGEKRSWFHPAPTLEEVTAK